MLRLDQKTTITFSAVEGEELSWLELLKGAVYSMSREPHTLKIKTPFVNAALEGTEFVVRVEPEATALWVFQGRVLASNKAGSLTLESGQGAVASTGEAPRRRLLARPRDAVQWTLYYPPIIDYRAAASRTGPTADAIREALARYQAGDLPGAFARLDSVPGARRDTPYFTLRAALLLSVGRIDEVRADIAHALKLDPGNGTAVALQSITAVVENEKEDVESVIAWLGRPANRPIQAIQDNHNQAVATLQVFLRAFSMSESLPHLRQDLARQIATVVRARTWGVRDLHLLRAHEKHLRQIDSVHAPAVQQAVQSLEVAREATQRAIRVGKFLLVHALFWLVLIITYPRSSQVQAIFFWNPWVRRITGLGYVGFALTWLPFLRSKLFAPFKASLLADAHLEGFDTEAYFEGSQVKAKTTGHSRAIIEAIPEIKRQIIIEGESGLGKTMFLRFLVQRSPRVVVYLRAAKCVGGVMEAIQAKLHGPARDPDFLRNLIYSGAIDICIDGLNEVCADTRADVTAFTESYFKGNIIIGTQPLEWTPPSTATTYILEPLTRERIEAFLLARKDILPADTRLASEDYEAACSDYLAEALNPQQPRETLEATQRILSNPMDLTVVAMMLARGKTPNLFHLQEQQYWMMAEDYKRVNIGHRFPLGKFSERVYQRRLEDKIELPEAESNKELQCMERHKMVVTRQSPDAGESEKRQWHFRHDKIMDFFIVQAFLGPENDRPQKHLGDARFRGVYFLLAMLLPLDDAATLQERLIDYAADSKDHTVSDSFVQLLRTRKAA